jgi:hypothetical protein
MLRGGSETWVRAGSGSYATHAVTAAEGISPGCCCCDRAGRSVRGPRARVGRTSRRRRGLAAGSEARGSVRSFRVRLRSSPSEGPSTATSCSGGSTALGAPGFTTSKGWGSTGSGGRADTRAPLRRLAGRKWDDQNGGRRSGYRGACCSRDRLRAMPSDGGGSNERWSRARAV